MKENQYSKGTKIFQTYISPNMHGKYIAVCEGDDYWCSSNKLQKQVDFLEAYHQYSACVHNTKFINCLAGQENLLSFFTHDKIHRAEDVLKYQWEGYMLMVSISGMTVSLRTDLRFPITGQQGHGSRNIHQDLGWYRCHGMVSKYRLKRNEEKINTMEQKS